MEDILFEKLEALKKKNNLAFNELNDAFKNGSSKKGDILVSADKICTQLYILQSGVVKQYRYKEDGSEHIIWFGFKGDLVTAFTSFVTNMSSKESIKVVEDCEYVSISRAICYDLVKKYHAVETFFREMLEIYLIQADERLYFLQAFSAKQKYAYIFKNFPHFLQKLPQKELSSFLGITRETLSRIRKQS